MTTLLAGVNPVHNGVHRLEKLYNRILHLLKKAPRNAPYKLHTEAIICHRLSIVCESCGHVQEVERNIGCGNIEMLIRQAEDEYILLQRALIWKPWEPLIEQPPPGQWTWPPY